MLVICTRMESETELPICIHKSTFVRTLNMYFYFADLLTLLCWDVPFSTREMQQLIQQ